MNGRQRGSAKRQRVCFGCPWKGHLHCGQELTAQECLHQECQPMIVAHSLSQACSLGQSGPLSQHDYVAAWESQQQRRNNRRQSGVVQAIKKLLRTCLILTGTKRHGRSLLLTSTLKTFLLLAILSIALYNASSNSKTSTGVRFADQAIV